MDHPSTSTTITQLQNLKNSNSSPKNQRLITLQPLAMRIPNRQGIYSPSKWRPKKTISYEDFLSRYSDYPIQIRVCFDDPPLSEKLLERSEFRTAYGFGLDCWYVILEDSLQDTPTTND